MYQLLTFCVETFISFNAHSSPLKLGLREIKGLGEMKYGHSAFKERSQGLKEPVWLTACILSSADIGDRTLGWGLDLFCVPVPGRAL